MNFKSIFFYLSLFCFPVGLLSFINILYSSYFNYFLSIDSYFVSLSASLIFGGGFYYFGKKANKNINFIEQLILIIFVYVFVGVLISIPFYMSSFQNTFINAFFESISGLTGTGFSTFKNIKYLDPTLILWRSSSQWIGGLYFLFSIILLIDIYDENFKKTLTNFISFDSSEIFKQAVKILLLYSLLTLIIFVILNIFSIRAFNSLNLAFTLISSGGFLPVNDLSSIIKQNSQIVVLSLLMLTSFFSIFFSYNLIFFKNKNVNFFYEDLHLTLYLISIISLFFLFFSFNSNFFINLLSITSSISNIGFSLKSSQENLSFIFLILVIIGGSFFSTSSGLRFIKIYSLFKYSINQILSFSRPKNVFMNKLIFTKINFDFNEINKYFLTILIFVISFFILTSLLALSGIEFERSFKLAILTLMNTVNSSIYGLAEFNFNNLHFLTKYTLIFFMIIGRIELLTILVLIKKFLLKN